MTIDEPRAFRVRTARQLRALSSPVRTRLVEALLRLGRPSSVREVGDRLGRDPSSLYYHFRVLERIGLVREAGSRPGTRRPERLYELVADRIVLDRSRAGPAFRRAEAESARARLREAGREAERAIGAGLSGASPRGARVTREIVRVTPETLDALHRLLDDAHALLERAHDPENPIPVSMTVCVSRLDA